MDVHTITNWANENQGIIAIGIFVLGVIGFFIKKLFFLKQEKLIFKNKSLEIIR